MPKTALVILGAGASHDVVPPRIDTGTPSTEVHPEFLPPLAKDIFTDSEPVRTALAAYPAVELLSSTIRASNKGLEDHLSELSDSATGFRQRGITEMPLYLRHLFTRISDYTKDPINYKALVQALFDNSGFDRIAILSLNYDLLLDHVLELDHFGGPFDTMDAYHRRHLHPELLYVKLHGSVEWAWPLRSLGRAQQPSDSAYLEILHKIAPLEHVGGDPEMASPHALFDDDGFALYPALAIPTGQYEFICPPAHVYKLMEFLHSCRNVLVIGCSAQDARLLRLLADNLSDVANFSLVDQGSRAEDVRNALTGAVPQMKAATDRAAHTYGIGFSEFLRTGGLDRFIAAAV